jgi:hypothetical protein
MRVLQYFETSGINATWVFGQFRPWQGRQTWNIALHMLQSTLIEFLLHAGRLSSYVAPVCAFGMLILRQRTCKCLVCFSQTGKTKHWLSLTRVRTRRAEGPGITAHAPSPPLASFSETKQVGCQRDMCSLQRCYNSSERKVWLQAKRCKDSVPASSETHINTWKKTAWKVFFFPMLPASWGGGMFPRLRPFLVLVRASTQRSNCPIATLPTTYPTCTDLKSKPGLRGKTPVEIFYLKIQLVPRSKHSSSRL